MFVESQKLFFAIVSETRLYDLLEDRLYQVHLLTIDHRVNLVTHVANVVRCWGQSMSPL
jgi:hypothetical protein